MQFINNLLLDMELNPRLVEYLSIIIKILFIAIICIVANFITKKIVIRIITHIVKNTKFNWDKMLLERKVFQSYPILFLQSLFIRFLQPFQPIRSID